jgi:hypothetical protein
MPELETVTEWPLTASAQVPAGYFQLPVAGQEQRSTVNASTAMSCTISGDRCGQTGFEFSLGGEINKLSLLGEILEAAGRCSRRRRVTDAGQTAHLDRQLAA